MRWAGIISGSLLAIAGIVWMLQGMGSEYAPQSFMTSSGEWIVIGFLTAVGGTAIAVYSWRKL